METNKKGELTPLEKAKDLVGKMYLVTPVRHDDYLLESDFFSAKRCAIIAVDEIISAIDWHEFETPNKEIEYWQKVKSELENYEN